jgi:Holliday junction resolvase RusA-like endonuclease
MLFEFVVPGIPRTAQTKKSESRKKWREKVTSAAGKLWPQTRPPLTSELSAIIVYYYTEQSDLDVDGIGKLVLDALVGTIVEDDAVFTQVLLRKSNQVGLKVSNPTSLLAESLGTYESFVYIVLDNAPNHEDLPT